MNDAATILELITPGPVLARNLTGESCPWCADRLPAGCAVTEAGRTVFACFRHARLNWPALIGELRASELAASFRMRLHTTCGNATVTNGWESFPTFAELFRESRKVAELDGFELVHSSTNKHYRTTGHHRMVLRAASGGPRSPRLVVHILMK